MCKCQKGELFGCDTCQYDGARARLEKEPCRSCQTVKCDGEKNCDHCKWEPRREPKCKAGDAAGCATCGHLTEPQGIKICTACLEVGCGSSAGGWYFENCKKCKWKLREDLK